MGQYEGVPRYERAVLNPTAVSANYFWTSAAMKATAYTLLFGTMPDGLARSITAKRTTVDVEDTGFALTVSGTDNAGNAISEQLALTTSATTYETVQAFKTFTVAISPAWVIGGTTADNLIIGYGTRVSVKAGSGVLHGWFVNTAVAAGVVTLTDGMPSPTTLLVIPSGAAAGSYQAGLNIGFATQCYATFAGTGNITFIYR